MKYAKGRGSYEARSGVRSPRPGALLMTAAHGATVTWEGTSSSRRKRARAWQENGRETRPRAQPEVRPASRARPPPSARAAPARPPSPEPEALPVLSAVLHGRGPPARPAAASHDARPVVGVALQVPGHGELTASHLVVSLAEAAALLVQRAQFRDGGVICGDETRHDSAFSVFDGVGTPAMARARAWRF